MTPREAVVATQTSELDRGHAQGFRQLAHTPVGISIFQRKGHAQAARRITLAAIAELIAMYNRLEIRTAISVGVFLPKRRISQ